jgi:CDP-paratose 2-epimerase
MRILISGVCGFVGSTLARTLAQSGAGHELIGFDNLIRPGSESNRGELRRLGVRLFHADARSQSDVDALPAADWVVDAAANPSVLAGVDGRTSTRQLAEHNLLGTVNLLEFCRRNRSGVILLSTSRVYGIEPLARLKVEAVAGAFRPVPGDFPRGLTAAGIGEDFSTGAPISLYGATKLASEVLALEYGESLGLPVFINRCGVLAGAGQFGRPDQGIFSFWIHSHLRRRPLRYIGFGGTGHQVRDCLHPRDLAPLLERQFGAPSLPAGDRIVNVGGGVESARSLRWLNDWCDGEFGPHPAASDPAPRPFDLPWIVLDAGKAERVWKWRPQTGTGAILAEIAAHARAHPGWLELSEPP